MKLCIVKEVSGGFDLAQFPDVGITFDGRKSFDLRFDVDLSWLLALRDRFELQDPHRAQELVIKHHGGELVTFHDEVVKAQDAVTTLQAGPRRGTVRLDLVNSNLVPERLRIETEGDPIDSFRRQENLLERAQ